MASVNKVTLIGNLGRDPEVRTFQNGSKVCNMTIATSESWRDKESGERKEKTEWHRIAIFNENIAKVAEQYLKKGSKVYIEGRLETRKWQDAEGKDQYSTEVVLRPFNGQLVMLDKAEGGEGSGSRSGGEAFGSGSSGGGRYDRKPGEKGRHDGLHGQGSGMDDEIPFDFALAA